MAWTTQKWINLRATAIFVTDGANQWPMPDSSTLLYRYPVAVLLDGDTTNAGWDNDAVNARDRDGAADPRLAGIYQFDNNGTSFVTFEWDVPNGTYDVRLAAGDPSNDRSLQEWEFLDDTVSLGVVTVSTLTPGGQWRDANGSLHTSNANWIANNTLKSCVIASGKLKIRFGTKTAQTDTTAVATIGIKAGSSAAAAYGRRAVPGPGISPDKRTTFSARPLSRQVLGATVSLSGQSLTASQGSVAPAIAIALTGQANTSAQGTVTPAVAVSVNGQQVSGAQDSVSSTTTYSAGRPTASGPGISPDYLKLFQSRRLSAVTPPTSDVSISLSGQALTSAQGSVVETISYSLTGQQASTAQGSIVGSNSYSLTGQAVTTAQGAVAEAVSVGLAGQGLTASQGVVSFSGDVARALVGQSMTVDQGLVSVTLAASVAGQQMSMAQGSINASASTISGVVSNRTVIMRGSDKTVILH